jgi:hypothetical protein
MTDSQLTPDDAERLRREALDRAQALRGEMLDGLWHELDRWLHRSAHGAARAAERLAHRLDRHRRLREAARRPGLPGSLSQD